MHARATIGGAVIMASDAPPGHFQKPQGDATNVSWLMHGPAPFMSKMMQVFINLDHMIGKDFEIGLANLKRLTEK